jgi:hypothetical protein
MNEPTQNPGAEQPVPVSVPVQIPARTAPAARANAGAAQEDQLPTSRYPSIAPLPPPLPPPGPARKGQLPATERDDATAKYALEAQRRRWQAVVADMKRAARAYGFAGAWTERRVGVCCAILGLAMIAGSLMLGWESVASERFDKVEHVSLAVALVLARAALAIAAMVVGYGLLRVGERTALSAGARDDRDIGAPRS